MIEVEEIFKKCVHLTRNTGKKSSLLKSITTSLTQICRYKRKISEEFLIEELLKLKIIPEFSNQE